MTTPNYTQYIYSDNIPYHITSHNIHLYIHMYVHPVYSTNPTCTRERTPSRGEHVYAPGRTHPQMTSTCWGTPYAPVGTPRRRAYMYMHPRGHPPDEHIPYVSSRAHARGKLGLGCGELFTSTQCNIQNKYIYTRTYL